MNEQNQKLITLTHDDKNRLFMTLDAHTKQNEEIISRQEKIELAVFGDDKVKYAGLMNDVMVIKAFIAELKAKRMFWLGVGAVATLLAKMFWEWILSGVKK